MNHEQLLNETASLADSLGVRWVHIPVPFRGSPRQRGHLDGFPDLFLAGPGGVAFAELKTGGQLAPSQTAWRDMLLSAGAAWYLWQPVDLLTGRIRGVLVRLALPGG